MLRSLSCVCLPIRMGYPLMVLILLNIFLLLFWYEGTVMFCRSLEYYCLSAESLYSIAD